MSFFADYAMVISLVSAVAIVILSRVPELALAILFNGTFIYFYSVYKLGSETNSVLTAAIYAVLNFAGLLGLCLKKSNGRSQFGVNQVDYLVAFTFLYMLLSFGFFSSNIPSAVTKVSFAPFMAIGPYLAGRLMRDVPGIKRKLAYIVLVGIALSIPSVYELFFNPNVTWGHRFSLYTFSGRDNPIMFGITFSVSFIVLFNWCYQKGKFERWALVMLPVFAFMVFRSGSRGALLSLMVTMAFMFLFISRVNLRKQVFYVVALLVFMAGVYSVAPEATIDFYRYTASEDARVNQDSSVNERIRLWEAAYSDFNSNPLLGVGFGGFTGSGYPHNIFLEVAAELGAVGLVSFTLLILAAFKRSFVLIARAPDFADKFVGSSVLLLFVYYFVEAFFSGYLTQQTGLFMALGIIAGLSVRDSKTPGIDKR
jgi:O-antigen ligase